MKAPVTVVGLGPMGKAMAETFLKNGHPTTVWNRTASKAAPLVEQGATLAATPDEALAASELVVISQTDYKAMYDSLEGAQIKGRVLVNLSSGSPNELRRAGEWAAGKGAALLTGGVMTPPPGIGQPGAYIMYSGPEELLDRHRETLRVLGDTTYVGADVGLSNLYYQAQLNLFFSTTAAYMHSIAMLQSAGVSAEQFRPFATETVTSLGTDGPMGFLRIIAEEADAGHSPGGENNMLMMAVGTDHIVEAAEEAGIDTMSIRVLRDLFWRTVNAGHGSDGLGSVIEVVRKGA
ncbi:NAD(P)-binding domain-containing protein [Spirillospora sp. NPDC052242]